MNQINNNFIQSENDNEQFSIREQLDKYLIYWKWFVVGIVVSLTIAFLYLRYSTNIYRAASIVMLKDDRKGGALNELATFSDLGLFAGTKNNVDNEIEVLRSRTLTEKTIQKLKLNISYYSEGRVKSFDIYKNTPINAFFLEMSEEYAQKNFTITVIPISDSKFTLKINDEKKSGEFTYGQTLSTKVGTFIITKNEENITEENKNNSTIVSVNTLQRTVNYYLRNLSVEALSKNTSVISLSLTNANKEKAEDFLNTLIEIYNKEAIADMRYVSEKTSQFINERLKIIEDELGIVETQAESFKKQNSITDIPTQASLYLHNTSELDKKILENEIKISMIDSVIDSFGQKNSLEDIIPVDILPTEANASGLIAELNKIVLKRTDIAKNAGPNSRVLKEIDAQISALKSSLKESLLRTKSNLNISLKDLKAQNAFISSKISQVPTLEKESRIIGRQQGIKEALYLYLLEKREETEISMAAIAPNAKIIDAAKAFDIPVSPKKNIVFLVAFILGLLIPFGVLYVLDLLDTKVKRTDVDKMLSIPFIGDVPRSESSEEVINPESRSSSAEALRIVRTNMEFILSQVTNTKAKTIFITSTLPREGKTFIAVNLAGTFALSGKKTLLIGMDIRNPKLSDYLKLPTKGLTNYLSTSSIELNSIIVKQEGYKEFYVMPPGVIPPNPAELLMSDKVTEMFNTLKEQFDYIIVDTAPVSLVTDTLLVAKNADAFIYVIREHYLDKRLLSFPQKLYKEKKLPNMSVLLNDTYSKKGYKGQYGYGYGYGQYFERENAKKTWYNKLMERILKR